MLVPVSCDAPLYHLPFATVGLILANVVVFVAMITGAVNPLDGWVLMYGQGMHPTEWLLSLFTHADFGHLLANMFFLWVFGMVTEGKLGWWRFLACYFVIGWGQSAIEQALMLHSLPGPGSVGASAAILGLLAMACVWAPMNDVKMIGLIGYYPISFDLAVGALAAIYVGLDLALVIFLGDFAGSSLLHLMGVVLGAILGVVLLKRKQVDCDRWDLFTVLRGEQGQPTKEELAPPPAEKVAAHQQLKAEEAKQKILAYLQIGQAPQALLVLRKVRDMKLPLELNRQEQFKLIAGLDQHKQWADSAPLMANYLAEFPDGSEAVRLLNRATLNDKQTLLLKNLTAVAKKQIDEGAVELDDVI